MVWWIGIPHRLYNIAQTRDDDYRECSTTQTEVIVRTSAPEEAWELLVTAP